MRTLAPLCVVNDGDVAKTNTCFDLVFVDYNGKVDCTPFMGTFKYIEPGLFILHYYEEKRLNFMTSKETKRVMKIF